MPDGDDGAADPPEQSSDTGTDGTPADRAAAPADYGTPGGEAVSSDRVGTHRAPPGAGWPGEDLPTVYLGLVADRNRELVEDCLAGGDDALVSVTDDRDGADLWLLDGRGYRREETALAAAKEAAGPTFLPALLVTDRETGELPAAVFETVDEVLTTPVSRAEIRLRVRALLERRRLTLALAGSEAHFRSLFAATPDPAAVLGRDGTIQRVNTAFETAFDVPATESVRLAALSGFDEGTATALRGDGGATTVTVPEADGDRRVYEASTAPLGTGRRLLFLRDVTDRVAREHELTRQNERLDAFSGILAHELRNPLNIAVGWLETARSETDPSDDGDAADAFDRVQDAHERMRRMIDELLRLSRQGTVVDDPRPTALSDRVEAAWGSVASGDATITIDVAPETTILADGTRLEDLLANLFRNSVDHFEADEGWEPEPDVDAVPGAAGPGGAPDDAGGTPAVAITVGTTADGFYVADDGPGIPEEDRTSVLEPGVTSSPTGTGFGLAIVREIAEAHGWTVSICESASGGTRVEVGDVAFPSGDD